MLLIDDHSIQQGSIDRLRIYQGGSEKAAATMPSTSTGEAKKIKYTLLEYQFNRKFLPTLQPSVLRTPFGVIRESAPARLNLDHQYSIYATGM